MTPKEYIEEFEKRFVVHGGVMPKHRDFGKILAGELKSYLVSTVISVLKEQMKEIDKMKRENSKDLPYISEVFNQGLLHAFLSLQSKIKEWEGLLDNK